MHLALVVNCVLNYQNIHTLSYFTRFIPIPYDTLGIFAFSTLVSSIWWNTHWCYSSHSSICDTLKLHKKCYTTLLCLFFKKTLIFFCFTLFYLFLELSLKVVTVFLHTIYLYSVSLSSGSDVSTQTQILSACTHFLFLRAREPVRAISLGARFSTAFGK